MKRRAMRGLVTCLLVIGCAAIVPRAFCGRDAGAFYAGERATQEALAAEVTATARAGVSAGSFSTGGALFDAEWALVSHQMAILGLGQLILEHPEARGAYLGAIEQCAERLLDPGATAFGAAKWGEPGLSALGSRNGHAYLGYVNLALSMLSLLDPGNRFAGVNEQLTEALARRMRDAPHGLIETYPGEAYPADVAAVVGSIGLFDRARGADHGDVIRRFAEQARARHREPGSGLLHQALDARTGDAVAPPRSSGTAIAAYFLSFADPALAGELFEAIARRQRATLLGFGAIREYPEGIVGTGDVDSGIVVLGVSISATGFSLAGARLFGHEALFTELYRTAELFGVAVPRPSGTRFMSGGPLGNAILLAMLTAGSGEGDRLGSSEQR